MHNELSVLKVHACESFTASLHLFGRLRTSLPPLLLPMLNLASITTVLFAATTIIHSPIASAQKVDSCSFPGVTCATCLARWQSGPSYTRSSAPCAWCGSRTTNSSDPGYIGNCFADNGLNRYHLCDRLGLGVYSGTDAFVCDVVFSPAEAAAIVTAFLSLVSAAMCYKSATAASKPRRPQYKWLAIGFLLPVISVLILFCLRKTGHFDSAPSLSNHSSFPAVAYASAPGDDPLSGRYSPAPNPPASVHHESSTHQYVYHSQDPVPPAAYINAYGQDGSGYQDTQMPYVQQSGVAGAYGSC